MSYRSSFLPEKQKKANINVDNIGAISGILKNLIKIDTSERIDNAKSKVEDYYSSKRATTSKTSAYTVPPARRYSPPRYRPAVNLYPRYEPRNEPKVESESESDSVSETETSDQGFESDASENEQAERVEGEVEKPDENVTCQIVLAKDAEEYFMSVTKSYKPITCWKCQTKLNIPGKKRKGLQDTGSSLSTQNKGKAILKSKSVLGKELVKKKSTSQRLVVPKKEEEKTKFDSKSIVKTQIEKPEKLLIQDDKKYKEDQNKASRTIKIVKKENNKKIKFRSATVAIIPKHDSGTSSTNILRPLSPKESADKKLGPFNVLLNHVTKQESNKLPEIKRTKRVKKPEVLEPKKEVPVVPECAMKPEVANPKSKKERKPKKSYVNIKKEPKSAMQELCGKNTSELEKPNEIKKPTTFEKFIESMKPKRTAQKRGESVDANIATGESIENTSGLELERGRCRGRANEGKKYQPPCVRRAEFLRRKSPNRKPIRSKTEELEEILLRPVRARSVSNVRGGEGTPWFDGFLKHVEKCEAEPEEVSKDDDFLKSVEKKKAGAGEEMDDKLREYEEQRQLEREREEEELRLLKEKQERRRQEREEEELLLAERIAEAEARRAEEEEALRSKRQEEKNKREEERRRRQEAAALLRPTGGGPNFTVEKKESGQSSFDKFGNIVKAKSEMGMTKDQREAHKGANIAKLMASEELQVEGLDFGTLKSRVKELHQRLCKLEATKYDLEERDKRQTYDLKELNERQRQIGRNKRLAKGLNPDEESNSPHPPKVLVVSKYDRQIDRRNFKERQSVYDKKNAIPHFPNCPPPPTILEKLILPGQSGDHHGGDEEGGEEEEEYEEEEEEEEEE